MDNMLEVRMSDSLHKNVATSRGWHSILLVLAGCFCYGLPSDGFAQDWQFQPTITLTADYNDNIRLNAGGTQDGGEATGGVLRAEARIWRQSPTGIARFSPAVRSSQYGTDADSNDYFMNAFFQHVGQKSEWTLEARYADEEVLNAEILDPDFDNPDIDNPITDDSGLVTVENRRNRLVLAPRVGFRLSQKTTLQFLGQYIDTGYDSGANSLSGFTSLYAEGALVRALSDKNTLGISLFGRNFDPDIQGFEADSYGAIATFERQVSAQNSGFVRVGYEKADIDSLLGGQVISESEGAFLFGVGATRQFEASRLVIDVQHSVSPSGIAELLRRILVRVRYVRELSERVRMTISVRYQDSKSILEDSALANRNLGRAELGLQRQLNRAWSVVGGYSYTRQEFADLSNAESSNAIYLGVQYSPPKRR